MVHMMPWFENRAVSGKWGWHWTMNKVDPDKGQIASHFHPLIGAYDSGDQNVIDCQVQLMKLSGIDGMFVDWYGDLDCYDYLNNHRNTQKLFLACKKAGLKFALVYEDQTVPNLISGNVFTKDQAVNQGRALLSRAAKAWFKDPTYLKQAGKPVFLVFGPQYYAEGDWLSLFAGLSPQPAFYTLHHKRGPAVGAYDWPLPSGGAEGCAKEQDAFLERSKSWPSFIPAAYPRFRDFYQEAGLHGYGIVDDAKGATFVRTLTRALASGQPFAQIATWNDWGEGTQIEPSIEFGYRDLEATQKLTRTKFKPADLRLPVELYLARKKGKVRLPNVPALLSTGKLTAAQSLLDQAK